jgi:Peptidase family M23
MSRHRIVRELFLSAVAAVLFLGMVAVPSPASAAASIVKPIVFPVDGPVTYTDTFGAPRSGHTHEGQDLMGAKMLPLLSAVNGIVHRVKFDNATGNSVTIKAADGWTYHYIHVNNDRPGTDDGQATRNQAFPPNIVAGATVTKGQVIAYLGDSGNAENAGSHLHFEIREPAPVGSYQGAPINPYESLQQATRWVTTPRWNLRGTPTPGPSEAEFAYGLQTGDRGLLCDWDADGVDEVVIVRSGVWYLRDGVGSGLTARQFPFGAVTDVPMCADLDGDPGDEPVLFRSGGTWTVRAGFGETDAVAWTVRYGLQVGDKPILGDWDGDGRSDLAIHRAGTWYIRTTGSVGGVPATSFRYGLQPGDQLVAGDWDGDGDDDAGVYRGVQWHLRSTAEATGSTTKTFTFGTAGSQPVVGAGTDPVKPGIGTFRPKSA